MPPRGVSSLYLFEQLAFKKNFQFFSLGAYQFAAMFMCMQTSNRITSHCHFPFELIAAEVDFHSPYRKCGRKIQNQIKTKQKKPPSGSLKQTISMNVKILKTFGQHNLPSSFCGQSELRWHSYHSYHEKKKTLSEKMTHFPQGTVQAGKTPHKLSPEVL